MVSCILEAEMVVVAGWYERKRGMQWHRWKMHRLWLNRFGNFLPSVV